MNPTDNSLRTVRLLTALLLVGMFAAGGVTGAGVSRWLAPPPPLPGHGPRPGDLPFPFGDLDLSAAQVRDVRQVMERHRPEIEAAVRETFPRVRTAIDAMETEARALLTAEQATRFDEIRTHRPSPVSPGPPMLPPPAPSPP